MTEITSLTLCMARCFFYKYAFPEILGKTGSVGVLFSADIKGIVFLAAVPAS